MHLLCAYLLGACAGDRRPADDVAEASKQDPPPAAQVAGAGGSQPAAAEPLDAGARPSSVNCAGRQCTDVPQFIKDLGGEPCCSQDSRCGVRIVGQPAFQDVCIPLGVEGDPSFDCPTLFDPQLFAYRYGCCLPDRTCGEEPLLGPEPFGCADLRLAGQPAGPSCDPSRSCKRHDTPCADAAECCPLSAQGAVCAAFAGAGGVCALHCQLDVDCPTQCCRSAESGERACAPAELCGL